jgi:hypothetical protein
VEEPPEVIGRRAELDEVARFLDRARTGRAAMTLKGPAGMGRVPSWLELWTTGAHLPLRRVFTTFCP